MENAKIDNSSETFWVIFQQCDFDFKTTKIVEMRFLRNFQPLCYAGLPFTFALQQTVEEMVKKFADCPGENDRLILY